MRIIPADAIEAAANSFLRLDQATPSSRRRERSWDFCYDHFQRHPKPTEVMELSCLHLGYYLASWGMLRGSSFLFKATNVKHYEAVIAAIEEHNERQRGWDVDQYLNDGRYESYMSAWHDIRRALLPEGGRALTLVSKVFLGVWGSLPSFDTYFIRTFRQLSEDKTERSAWGRANRRALEMLHSAWVNKQDEIERVRQKHRVWSMDTGQPTSQKLPVAKVMDIYGFHTAWAQSRKQTLPPSA